MLPLRVSESPSTPLIWRITAARRVVREGTWIIIGQFAAALGALVFVRVTTGVLRPAQYGQLALCLTGATLVNQVVMGGLVAGVGRFYSIALEQAELQLYLRASVRLMLYATAVVGVTAVAAVVVLNVTNHGAVRALVAGAFVFAVLTGWNAAFSAVQNAARQRMVVALHGGAEPWLRTAAVLAGCRVAVATSGLVISAYAGAAICVLISQAWFLARLAGRRRLDTGRHDERSAWVGRIWRYSWPFSGWGIFTWAQLSSDRWALALMSTESQVGMLSVLSQIGNYPITLVSGLASSLLGPILYEKFGSGTNEDRITAVSKMIERVTIGCFVVTIVATLFGALVHRWIFLTIAAPQYTEASAYLPWVLLSAGVFAAAQFLTLQMMTDLRSREMLALKIGTACVGVVLNFAGARIAGLAGVIAASVIFSVVYFGWTVAVCRTAVPAREAELN